VTKYGRRGTDAQYLIVSQHNFGTQKTGNRYMVKDVVYMRLVVCWGLTEIHHQLGGMSHLSGTRKGGGTQGVQGWPPPIAHPDNNSSGGEISPRRVPTQSQAHQSQGQSESSSRDSIESQQQNSLQDTGCEQDRQFLDVDTVNGILASRTVMESMPISSQAVQLRTYVNDTLFHMVKFIESTSIMLEEIIMPIVVKSFGLSEGENMSSSWAVRTRKGICSFLSTKRSNITVDLKTVFEKSKWLRREDFVTAGLY
jgi:hypothetical protein